MSKLFSKKLLFLLVILFAVPAYSQDLTTTDLSKVNVDQLTDEQIRKFVERANQSGLTQSQLETLAQQRGMSSNEISKLRQRIQGLERTDQPASAIDTDRSRDPVKTNEETLFDDIVPEQKEDEADRALRIFGSKIFENNNYANFVPSQNIATPENYILGPGDEVIIDIYGASEITYQQTISPDGKILISGVGPISLAGIPVKVAKKRVFNRLTSIYAGLQGPRPNTFMELSIGNVRTILVSVLGHAVNPGTYALSSFSTAFNAFYAAGGPSEKGSMRVIEVYREGEKIAELDAYKLFFDGDKRNDPFLRDEDVLVVKPYANRISFSGEVRTPAIYELKGQETLDDLIKYSGGFTSIAYSEYLTISRNDSLRRSVKTVKEENFADTELKDGDEIMVQSITTRFENRVMVEGAVYRPGTFELTDGLSLSGLVKLAGGFTEDVFLGRGNIIRQKSDLTLTNIAFDVGELIEGSQDILLKNEDIIRIPSIFDIEGERTIELKGEVRNPGVFAYTDSMTVEDLITLSGGLKKSASTSIVEVARRISKQADVLRSADIFTFTISPDLKMDQEASTFILQPFDLVLIKANAQYREQKTVKIEGEVNNPGFYALESEEDLITELIDRAGGLTPFAYPEGASLIRNIYSDSDETTRTNSAREYMRKRFSERIKEDSLDRSILETQISVGIELEKAIDAPTSKFNIILQDGDVISIPQKLETVRVSGEVFFPTSVKHDPGYSLKKYVSLAGGFSEDARKSKSYIIYANGRAGRTSSFLGIKFYPKVKPGADIIVPKKPERQQLNAQQWVAFASSIATLALIIDNLTNN